jgi:transcriptional regulator with XRE-family HTH domain
MSTFTIKIGPDYFRELDARLKDLGITHAAFSREMGISPVQAARWFNKPQNPEMNTLMKIEKAVDTMRRRKAQQGKRK